MQLKDAKKVSALIYEPAPVQIFSEELKQGLVEKILGKQVKMSVICETYKVSRASVYRWLKKYSHVQIIKSRIVVEKDSEEFKSRELAQEVFHLQQQLGKKQMELEYLQTLIEIASKHLEVDIKKNFAPKVLSAVSKAEKPKK